MIRGKFAEQITLRYMADAPHSNLLASYGCTAGPSLHRSMHSSSSLRHQFARFAFYAAISSSASSVSVSGELLEATSSSSSSSSSGAAAARDPSSFCRRRPSARWRLRRWARSSLARARQSHASSSNWYPVMNQLIHSTNHVHAAQTTMHFNQLRLHGQTPKIAQFIAERRRITHQILVERPSPGGMPSFAHSDDLSIIIGARRILKVKVCIRPHLAAELTSFLFGTYRSPRFRPRRDHETPYGNAHASSVMLDCVPSSMADEVTLLPQAPISIVGSHDAGCARRARPWNGSPPYEVDRIRQRTEEN